MSGRPLQVSDPGFQALGDAVLRTEGEALLRAAERLDERFERACRLLLECGGRVVVLGMGKSGHIGGKIAATLASTGTPAFFVHPGEAGHGDLGMIQPGDVVLAISHSGETEEILTLLPLVKRLEVPLIALSGKPNSSLAGHAEVCLDTGVEQEACPLGLTPTASTTVALALGDALAVALLSKRGFSADDFALSHPSGSLGRRLLLRIDDIMHRGEEMPCVGPHTLLAEALVEITRKGLGFAVVLTPERRVAGMFTDGNLRRSLEAGADIRRVRIGDLMTANCKVIKAGRLAAEALAMMERFRINALPVVNEEGLLQGVLNMHDLLRAGVV